MTDQTSVNDGYEAITKDVLSRGVDDKKMRDAVGFYKVNKGSVNILLNNLEYVEKTIRRRCRVGLAPIKGDCASWVAAMVYNNEPGFYDHMLAPRTHVSPWLLSRAGKHKSDLSALLKNWYCYNIVLLDTPIHGTIKVYIKLYTGVVLERQIEGTDRNRRASYVLEQVKEIIEDYINTFGFKGMAVTLPENERYTIYKNMPSINILPSGLHGGDVS